MRKIAVLLTVYNRKETTLECLKILFKQEIPLDFSIDVYLLNDACTDGTPEAVRSNYPQVVIVDSKGDFFWNHGMIKIWEYASSQYEYDFYLWLNDDTLLKEECISSLISVSSTLGDNSILVGTTCDPDDYSKLTYGGRNDMRNILSPLIKEVIPCKFMNGNIVLIPMSVFNIVGTNDRYYFHSRGDFDYSLRAIKLGVQVYVAPNVLGFCSRHDYTAKWLNPNVSIKDRFKLFFSSRGFYARQDFHFNRVHFGLIYALLIFFRGLLHVLFPKIGINRKF